MNYILRSLLYNLTRKRVNEHELSIKHVYVKKQDVSYFNLSTNCIVIVRNNGKTLFFRECPKLLPEREFFETAIYGFFNSVENITSALDSFSQEVPIVLEFSSETMLMFEKYIKDRTKDKKFIKKISCVDLLSEKYNFSIWKKQVYDQTFFERFGLNSLPKGTENIAVYFLWCIRSAAASYRTINIARGKDYSFFCALRSISSEVVAQHLNLSHMIPSTEFCVLHIDTEKEIFGVLSTEAPGVRMSDSRTAPNANIQKELINLNVLDLVSHQVDHGPNNYTFLNDGKKSCVCAFDNDNPYTFLPVPFVSVSFAGCSPFVDKNGVIARPYLDIGLCEKINTLNISKLEKDLKPYLNFIQRMALSQRLKLLKKAIKKTQKTRQNFLLSDSDWNDKTVAEELSGKYGVTYLTKALNRYTI